MWCKQCQQDVPAVVSAEGGPLSCPRCGHNVANPDRSWQSPVAEPDFIPDGESTGVEFTGVEFTAGEDSVGPTSARSDTPSGSSDYDGWEFDEQLRHIRRVLDKSLAEGRERPVATKNDVVRLDQPHAAGSAGWHLGEQSRTRRKADRKADSRPRGPFVSVLAWASLSLGTMVFVCGGILLGWSVIGNRPELWSVGLPVAAGGQVCLLLGLVLQLERLWHDSRRAASKLDRVDEQLHDLKTTATMLHNDHASPSSSFYAHMAGGANPRLLLTDLKSQLDLLAMKLDQIDE